MFHFIVIAGLILNNGQIFAGSKPITLRSSRRNVAPLERHVRHRAVRITICRHASPRHVSCTRVTCIALTPACTFHGGTCFGKGRSHFVIAFLPHPEENPATYSSSTRATDLRQLRDLCKPFSLSLSSQLFPLIFPLSLRISHALSPFFQPIYLSLSPSVRNYLRKSEAKKERKILLLGNAWKRSNSRSFPRLDFPGSRAKRGCGKLLLRAVVLGRLEGRK